MKSVIPYNATQIAAQNPLGSNRGLADAIYTPKDIDVSSTPKRDWVYDQLALSGYITTAIASGGTGKSMLMVVIAISVALGRPLINGHTVQRQRNVLLLNNEDDKNELNRRIAGVCGFYDIKLQELDNRLFIHSGYENPVVVVKNNEYKGVHVTEHRDELINFVKQNDIGLVIADPYVSFHEISENDNTLQNEVVKVFRYICSQTQAAVILVAHTKKLGHDSEAHVGDVESTRGATAVKDGARIAFTRAPMSKEKAKKLNIDWKEASRLFRLDDAKKNLSPLEADPKWFRMASYQLPNDDDVGVPEAFNIAPYIEAAAKNNDKKMTAIKWAKEIEHTLTDDIPCKDSFKYSVIKERLRQQTGYGMSSIEGFVTLLSQEQESPTRIQVNGITIEYWATKDPDKKTAPWYVNRREVN